MLHTKTNLFTIFILIFISGILKAQYVHPIEQVDPTVAQFPIVKGVGDPGYTGDLNVNIPLLKIPGRGGLDYDIELQYVHGNGVPASESSSWVGLGWNLNQYQITCNPTYHLKTTVSGAVNVTYHNRTNNDQSDLYFLTFPGGSTPIRKFSDGKWCPLKWSAIDIKPDISVASEINEPFHIYNDYKRFVVTDINGTKYIFSSALRKKTNKKLFNHPKPDGSQPELSSFYYVFKLTSILSSDYVDGGGNQYVPEDGGSDRGNWIKILYSDTEQLMNTDASEVMEINHIKEIVTPTHKAIFNLNPDLTFEIIGFTGLTVVHPLRSIELRNSNTQLIKNITFYTSPKFSWVENKYYLNTNQQRAGLDSVVVSGSDGISIPPYKFKYYPNPDETLFYNTLHPSRGVDGWGLYTIQRSISYPDSIKANLNKCWMLQSIKFPTGTVDSFYYECDRYQPYLYSSRGAGTGDWGIHVLSGIKFTDKE